MISREISLNESLPDPAESGLLKFAQMLSHVLRIILFVSLSSHSIAVIRFSLSVEEMAVFCERWLAIHLLSG